MFQVPLITGNITDYIPPTATQTGILDRSFLLFGVLMYLKIKIDLAVFATIKLLHTVKSK